jgi:hypothetical protein
LNERASVARFHVRLTTCEKEFKATCRRFFNSMPSLPDAVTGCAPNCAFCWNVSLRHRNPFRIPPSQATTWRNSSNFRLSRCRTEQHSPTSLCRRMTPGDDGRVDGHRCRQGRRNVRPQRKHDLAPDSLDNHGCCGAIQARYSQGWRCPSRKWPRRGDTAGLFSDRKRTGSRSRQRGAVYDHRQARANIEAGGPSTHWIRFFHPFYIS